MLWKDTIRLLKKQCGFDCSYLIFSVENIILWLKLVHVLVYQDWMFGKSNLCRIMSGVLREFKIYRIERGAGDPVP